MGGGVNSKSMQLHQMSPIETQEAFLLLIRFNVSLSASLSQLMAILVAFPVTQLVEQGTDTATVEGLVPSRAV